MENTRKKLSTDLMRFLELFSNASNNQLRVELIDLFFTEQEKHALNDRYNIIKALINAKQTQREIAKELNVSIAKITRGSNELKNTSKKMLEYLKEELD